MTFFSRNKKPAKDPTVSVSRKCRLDVAACSEHFSVTSSEYSDFIHIGSNGVFYSGFAAAPAHLSELIDLLTRVRDACASAQ